MNHYLANIASRNSQDNTQSLFPITSPLPTVNEDGFSAGESDNSQEHLLSDKPVQIHPLNTPESHSEIPPSTERVITKSYFTKHTERLNYFENNNTLKNNYNNRVNNHLEIKRANIEEPSDSFVIDPPSLNWNDKLSSSTRQKKLNILPENGDMRKPIVKKNNAQHTEKDEGVKPIIEQKQLITPSTEKNKTY